MSTGIKPITRWRSCRRAECAASFQTPHGGAWPQAYCSPECHRLDHAAPKPRHGAGISPASAPQREKVRGQRCIMLDGCSPGPVHPAHLIDRSLGGDDDPFAVIPLCALHHRRYDDGQLSLLEHLEPRWRDELAYAVRLVGLVAALERITNERYAPVREASTA